MAENAEGARLEHEACEALADDAPELDWGGAALDALGVEDGIGLVVKVNRTWRSTDPEATRQAAVVGDWDCSAYVAPDVRVVVGVAGARVVEAWRVRGHEQLPDGRIRFHAASRTSLDTSDVPLPEAILRARGHRYLRRSEQTT